MTDEAEHDEASIEVAPSTEDVAPEPLDSEIEEVDEIEQLRAESEAHREKYLRLAAEFDNFRKRSTREIENARKYGIERLAAAVLPVVDSLEAALAVEHVDVEALLEGQRATLRLLAQALESVGVEQIDPQGEPFDPNLHEAMSMLPSPHAEPDSIVDVVQKGYVILERLLRPARVIVAAAPPAAAEESAD